VMTPVCGTRARVPAHCRGLEEREMQLLACILKAVRPAVIILRLL
jgi:hypothetical protein